MVRKVATYISYALYAAMAFRIVKYLAATLSAIPYRRNTDD